MTAAGQHLSEWFETRTTRSTLALAGNLALGGALNNKPPPFHFLLRDLPEELQQAVHEAVAACQPYFRPRLYAHDWQEELYHEAACAACEAWRSYDPAKGSLYDWGLQLIGQRLKRFSDGVWAVARMEYKYPCDGDG